MMVLMDDGDGVLIQLNRKLIVFMLSSCPQKNVGNHGERLFIKKRCNKGYLFMDT